MLKRKIDEVSYNALNVAIQGEYKKVGDEYQLDTEDLEDVGPIKRALDRERENVTKHKATIAEMETQLDELRASTGDKTKEKETLEKSWQAKLDKAVKDHNESTTKLQSHLTNLLVDNKAIELANEISIAPKLIIPHIKARLKAELEGDEPITRVLDKDGKPSAFSLADLKKELASDPDFKSIIKGSNASGGGAGGGGQGGGGADQKKFGDLNEQERTALYNSDRAEFDRQSAAHKNQSRLTP